MASRWRPAALGAGAFLVAAVVASLGCPGRGVRPVTRPEPPPASAQPPPEPPPPPMPSQAELTIQAAREAEARGDHPKAVEFYEKAAGLPMDGADLAEVRYRLALLHADPASAARNIELAQAELRRFAEAAQGDLHAQEARVILSLIDDVTALRAQSTDISEELEELKTQMAALRKQLEEREKELAGIKKVLLQNKNKP